MRESVEKTRVTRAGLERLTFGDSQASAVERVASIRDKAVRKRKVRSRRGLVRYVLYDPRLVLGGGVEAVVVKQGKVAPAIPERAFANSAKAKALLRGAELATRDLERAGGTYTLKETAQLLHCSPAEIERQVAEGSVLAVAGPAGSGPRFPAIQFTSTGLLSGLSDALAALPSRNPWFALNFLVTPAARLGGKRPVDKLRKGELEPVLATARAIGVQGS